mgnify:CR=1 FL=1
MTELINSFTADIYDAVTYDNTNIAQFISDVDDAVDDVQAAVSDDLDSKFLIFF